MNYTIIIRGKSYELPAKTMKVVEKMEELERVDSDSRISIREKYRKVYDFFCMVVGKDNANEILGSDKLEEVDLNDITVAYLRIKQAYDKPIEDFNTNKTREKLDMLPLDKIIELSKVAKEQGLSR